MSPKVTIEFHFNSAPVRVLGTTQVVGLEVASTRPEADGERRTLGAQAVISSIGYHVTAPAGAPTHPDSGIVVNSHGRVGGRLYVTGWAKRGPSGVIGTNKACAAETVEYLCRDLTSRTNGDSAAGTSVAAREALIAELRDRQRGSPDHAIVDHQGWTAIDAAERRLGEADGRSRTKIADLSTLLGIAARAETTQS